MKSSPFLLSSRKLIRDRLELSKLLNRVPIIPEFLWARACVVSEQTCARYSLEYWPDRNAEGRHKNIAWGGEGGAWKLPISAFLDLENLRARYGPVLTLREFLDLQGLQHIETQPNGRYEKDQVPPNLKVDTLPAAEFETPPSVRVDRLAPIVLADPTPTLFDEAYVRKTLGDRQVWTLSDARDAMCSHDHFDCARVDDDDLDRAFVRANVTRLYTFGEE